MLIRICIAMCRCAPITDIAERSYPNRQQVDYAHFPKLMHLSRLARAREILYSFHGWGSFGLEHWVLTVFSEAWRGNEVRCNRSNELGQDSRAGPTDKPMEL